MSDEFWDTVEPLMAEGVLTEGTIMNGPCVRDAGGEFVAMPHHKGAGMVVKLPRERVHELIDQRVGQPFAPAGKVFKERVLVTDHDDEVWLSLLRESLVFVGS